MCLLATHLQINFSNMYSVPNRHSFQFTIIEDFDVVELFKWIERGFLMIMFDMMEMPWNDLILW